MDYLVMQNQNNTINIITSPRCRCAMLAEQRELPGTPHGVCRLFFGTLRPGGNLFHKLAHLVDPRMQAVVRFDVGASRFDSIKPRNRLFKATLNGFGELVGIRFRDKRA